MGDVNVEVFEVVFFGIVNFDVVFVYLDDFRNERIE